jgi:hypothetical protein
MSEYIGDGSAVVESELRKQGHIRRTDHTCDAQFAFGRLTVHCEISYEYEPEADGADPMIVNDVIAIQAVYSVVGSRTLIDLTAADVLPVAEDIATGIERRYGEAIRSKCVEDWQSRKRFG